MRLDAHVHTRHSGYTTIRPLHRIVRESYNTPMGAYGRARRRGMDLVTITDHDQVAGALEIAHLPGVIVGCEVTACFPDDPVRVHLNVLDITEAQHREIQRLRHDVRELMPYLRGAAIFTSLNHVASGVNGPVTAAHVAAILPWVDALEVNNGSRLPAQNRTALAIADAAGKTHVGGSDAHTRRGIGRTWVDVPGATTVAQFMAGLRAGRSVAGGRQGSYFTMAEDMLRFAGGFYQERARTLAARPLDWRAHAFVFGGVLGLPLIALPLAGAYVHFIAEERFNRELLYDLVARPAPRRPALAPAIA